MTFNNEIAIFMLINAYSNKLVYTAHYFVDFSNDSFFKICRLSQNAFISLFTNRPSVIFWKVEKKSKIIFYFIHRL